MPKPKPETFALCSSWASIWRTLSAADMVVNVALAAKITSVGSTNEGAKLKICTT